MSASLNNKNTLHTHCRKLNETMETYLYNISKFRNCKTLYSACNSSWLKTTYCTVSRLLSIGATMAEQLQGTLWGRCRSPSFPPPCHLSAFPLNPATRSGALLLAPHYRNLADPIGCRSCFSAHAWLSWILSNGRGCIAAVCYWVSSPVKKDSHSQNLEIKYTWFPRSSQLEGTCPIGPIGWDLCCVQSIPSML